jgi:predicted nuclease with TOPRIM domain|tara:strand:+ start:175 stop:468 length:294 start_codon:yes stop_codon:yes gene_type:complete
MNKHEIKWALEHEQQKTESLIDINGINAHHIRDLYAEIKRLKDVNDKLIVRLNDKREENYQLRKKLDVYQQQQIKEAMDDAKLEKSWKDLVGESTDN